MRRMLLALLLVYAGSVAFSQTASRDVEITARDGAKLRATYFAAAKPGPAVILLHMCNTDRKSWQPVAQQLRAVGISALTIDNRGFGESGGPRYEHASAEHQQQLAAKWPADFDMAFAWLLAQSGVEKNRIGAGGGSCGVDNAVKLASRHAGVRSLVLLAGSTDFAGLKFLQQNAWMPLFTAAAADDEYNPDTLQIMRWFAEVAGNPRNEFVGFHNGRHGTEIFGPHPELPRRIVDWYLDTLVRNPATVNAPFTPKKTLVTDFWTAATQPGGAARAAQMFRDARKGDPQAFIFPELPVNLLAYGRLQQGGVNIVGQNLSSTAGTTAVTTQAKQDALLLFKLNVEAFPNSANAQDSLADGYLAMGEDKLALVAEQKCLALLPADKGNDEFKAKLGTAAKEKIAKLKQSSVHIYPVSHQ